MVDKGFAYWHSATFNNDGTKVVFTDEWGGGGRPRCQASDPRNWGADAIYDALFRKYNICRAYTAEEFYDYAKALAYLKPPKGNRILFITTSGGAAILATDQAEQEGLDVSPLPKEAVEAITPLIPAHAIKANPIDLTGDATAQMFGDVIEVTRKYYDTLGVIFGDPVGNASSVVTPNANELIIFYGGADVERYESERMHLKGIPVFPTPERGIKALAQILERKTLDAPHAGKLMAVVAIDKVAGCGELDGATSGKNAKGTAHGDARGAAQAINQGNHEMYCQARNRQYYAGPRGDGGRFVPRHRKPAFQKQGKPSQRDAAVPRR